MTLAEIMELREGQRFHYKGEEATVHWRQYVDEIVGETQDGIILHCKSFGMYFIHSDGKQVTLRSSFPSPANLQLEHYTA